MRLLEPDIEKVKEPKTLMDQLVNTRELSFVLYLISKSEWVDKLSDSALEYTLLAPTDTVMEQLAQQNWSDATQEEIDAFLDKHIVKGRIDLLAIDTFSTISGHEHEVNQKNDEIYINGSIPVDKPNLADKHAIYLLQDTLSPTFTLEKYLSSTINCNTL